MEAFNFAQWSVYDLRRYLISKGITVGNFKKASLVKLADAAASLHLEDNVDFHEDILDLSKRLRITGVQMPDPFSIPESKLTNRLSGVPPFGIDDIFNFLVFKSSEYDKQKIASYKAFEEYALFEDGYVQDMKVHELNGHFIFVGKVKPTMLSETTNGKCYKLWFIVDGTRTTDTTKHIKWSPTAGLVFSAYCVCPGGQDGACKHIAAAMYSLHDCLYPEGKAPTEQLCYWKKRQTVDTCPLPVNEVKVAKASTLMKKHNFKSREKMKGEIIQKSFTQKKTRAPFKDKIDFDPRIESDRGNICAKKLKEIKSTLNEFNCVAGLFLDSEDESEISNEMAHEKSVQSTLPVIYNKVKSFLTSSKSEDNGYENFLHQLTFTCDEREEIEKCTRGQGAIWKEQRKGFLTSTKLKDIYTRQKCIEKDHSQSGKVLAERCLQTDILEKYIKLPEQIQYGRNHEEVARTHYKKLMSQIHVNFKLVDSGLQISEYDQFVAASPDNLRQCKCCGKAVVEYKCPYTNKHLHPREAFLDKSVGGEQNSDGTYSLNPKHKYYFQIQGAMASVQYDLCDFVIYTQNASNNYDGSIFVVQVPFSINFWSDVRRTVRQFYLTWMLPIIFDEVSYKEEGSNKEKRVSDMECLDIEDENETHMMIIDEENKECNVNNSETVEMIVDDETPAHTQSSLGDLKGVPIFQDDINSLNEGCWLTDNIIVLFCRILRENCDISIFSNLIILDSIFYLSLSSSIRRDSLEIACRKASSYFKEMHASSIVVFPICSHSHWYAIIFTPDCIIVMDSMGHQSSENVFTRSYQINLISNFIYCKFKIRCAHLKRFVLKSPQQTNNYDCGVYLILNLKLFLQPENFRCFMQDPSTYCRKEYTEWFNAETAKRERVKMKDYIIHNLDC